MTGISLIPSETCFRPVREAGYEPSVLNLALGVNDTMLASIGKKGKGCMHFLNCTTLESDLEFTGSTARQATYMKMKFYIPATYVTSFGRRGRTLAETRQVGTLRAHCPSR
jgi:hypothetical protein